MLIDLHTHSTVSDGTDSPAEVVSCVAQAGLDVFALTDHDTTMGWDEAAAAARQHGIALVRGIEISCQHEGVTVHLLGYLQDPAAPGLLEELDWSRLSRRKRAQHIVELMSADLDLHWEGVLEHIASLRRFRVSGDQAGQHPERAATPLVGTQTFEAALLARDACPLHFLSP